MGKSTQAGGAKCGALGAHSDPIAPDLAEIIDCWSRLSENVKLGILAMVRAAGQE